MSDKRSFPFGFEIPSGAPVDVPPRHTILTGQTQEAGKTTATEGLITRAGVRALTFVTKPGEGSFRDARRVDPYFREQADWQFVASILEASRGERLKYERAWIIRASKGARTLADVQRNVRAALKKAKGQNENAYLCLDAYLDAVVPQIAAITWARSIELSPGLNVMDLTGLHVEMQHLVIRSSLDWVLNREQDTMVIVPEAWKFIPQGRGTPVKLAAEAYIRQGAGMRNYLILDSQDIAGVEKIILKSIPVWILGVQRESNEVKRTLAQIPANIKKPRPEQIATLGLGQFFVCFGSYVIKTYAWPDWMSEADARAIARGEKDIDDVARPASPAAAMPDPTDDVQTPNPQGEDMPDAIAETNQKLDQLIKLMTAQAGAAPAASPPAAMPPGQPAAHMPKMSTDEDAMYNRFKARLMADAPALLKVMTSRPELRVEVETVVLETKGETLRGQCGILIAKKFFDTPRTGTAAEAELRRKGIQCSRPNVYRELDKLAAQGFLRKEESGYESVPDMKVNIVEKGAAR